MGTTHVDEKREASGWRVLLPFAALLFVALAIVAGLGWQETAVREWFVWGSEKAAPVTFTTEIVLDPQAQTATVNGEPMSISWGSYAETDFSEGYELTATLEVLGVSYEANYYTIPLVNAQIACGPMTLVFAYDHSETDEDDNVFHYYTAGVLFYATIPGTFVVPGDGAYHSFDISIDFEAGIDTRYGTDIIGEKGQTHAKEGRGQDQVVIDGSSGAVVSVNGSSATINRDLGAISPRGYVSFDLNSWSDVQGSINYVGLDWVRFTDISFNGAEIDASLLSERITDVNPMGSATGEKLHVYGNGSTIAVEQDVYVGTALNWRWSAFFDPAQDDRFSGIGVADMLGTAPVGYFDDLLIGTNWWRYDAAGAAWERVVETLATLRAAHYIEDYGRYPDWDPATPPDGAMKFIAPELFYIDPDSAEAHGLRGIPSADDFVLKADHTITAFPDADDYYWQEGTFGGENAYTNGLWWVYYHPTYEWSLGLGTRNPPHFISSDGSGPTGSYIANTTDFDPSTNPDWDGTKVVSVTTPSAAEQQAAEDAIDPAVPSFKHDLTIVIDGWPLSRTGRDVSPYVTNIASIAHESAVGILADGDDLTDMAVVADATAPNVAGEFEVTAAGGGIKYSIPSNWGYRNTVAVQDTGTPSPSAPNSYQWMRHDIFYGADPEDETTHEGIYCWRGWRYLYVDLTAPSAGDVTVTVRYYGDITVGDNHKTDSTRQTSLDVDLGSLSTLTRTITLEAGAQTVCVDLAPIDGDGNRLPPLHLVAEVEFAFDETGNWTISEPTLDADQGNVQTGRVAVTSHSELKWFENAGYLKGGFSAAQDGHHLCALYMYDEDAANLVERTLGNFNRTIGAKTGIDLTSAFGLGAGMTHVTNSSDAWVGSYSTGAAEGHFRDGDGVWLKSPSVTDLRPVMQQDLDTTTALDVAVRVAEWYPVRGLPYVWHGTKFVWGSLQGWAHDSSGTIQRTQTDVTDIWRRVSGGSWAVYDATVPSDGHGRFVSDAGSVYQAQANGVLYSYGVGASSPPTDTGRWATREYDSGDLAVIPRHDVWMSPSGLLYRLKAEGNDLKIYWLPYPSSTAWGGGSTLATASEAPQDLCLRGLYTQPYLQAAWREGTKLMLAHTHDQGDTCVGPYEAALGYSVMRHEIVGRRWFTAGLKSGAWYIRYREPQVLPPSWLPFASGNTEETIATSTAEEMFLASDRRGALHAVFDGLIYTSYNGGADWINTGSFTPTGWSQLCGWVLGQRLMVYGYDGGWKVKNFTLIAGVANEVTGAGGTAQHDIAGAPFCYGAQEIAGYQPLLVCSTDEVYYSNDSGENWVELT